jgi:transcriptional regulator with XRE-family HTH domain
LALRTVITERQRRIGAELRAWREASGLTAADAGKLIEMGTPQLSHIEAGRTGIQTDRMRSLLAAYGCKDAPYTTALIELAQEDGKGWWTEYRKRGLASDYLDIAEVEARARAVDDYQALLIPGLIQTPDYMRALFLNAGNSQADADVFADFRLQRQSILTGEKPVRYHAVIHEAALRMAIGGSDVMRQQLQHLVDMSRRSNITIQAIPFGPIEAPSFTVAIHAMKSAHVALTTLQMESPTGMFYLGDRPSIDRYGDAFDKLASAALPPVSLTAPSRGTSVQRDSLLLIQAAMYQI